MRHGPLLAVFIASVLSSGVLAQSTQPSIPAEQKLDEMLKAPATAGGGQQQATGRPLTAPATAPAVDATSGGGAVAPRAPSVTVLREGTYLVDRTGRLTRSADGGQVEFTFESDGRAMADPPVIIIPNLKLMAMENAVQSSSRDLKFRVTGMVTEYRGRNYLLLEKVVVVPEVTQTF